MNEIKECFSKLTPSPDFTNTVLAAATEKKSKRLPWKGLLIAAIIFCFVTSAAAVGVILSQDWIGTWYGTNGDSAYVESRTTEGGSFGEVNGIRVSLDRVFSDGPFCVLQMTLQKTDGTVFQEDEINSNTILGEIGILKSRCEERAVLTPPNGMNASCGFMRDGFASAWYTARIDDGSKPEICVLSLNILLDFSYADEQALDGTVLHFDLVNGESEEMIATISTELHTQQWQYATLPGGIQVRLNSMGLELNGYEWASDRSVFSGSMLTDYRNCGICLRDGTKVPFFNGMVAWSLLIDEEIAWAPFSFAQSVRPEEVTAIYTPEGVYPLRAASATH